MRVDPLDASRPMSVSAVTPWRLRPAVERDGSQSPQSPSPWAIIQTVPSQAQVAHKCAESRMGSSRGNVILWALSLIPQDESGQLFAKTGFNSSSKTSSLVMYPHKLAKTRARLSR